MTNIQLSTVQLIFKTKPMNVVWSQFFSIISFSFYNCKNKVNITNEQNFFLSPFLLHSGTNVPLFIKLLAIPFVSFRQHSVHTANDNISHN